MCCRYFINDDAIEILNEKFPGLNDRMSITSGDIYPSETALAIMGDGRNNNIVNMVWGLRTKEDTGIVINSRSETVKEKISFRNLILKKRCIIPATCFYEWDEERNKASFYSPDGPIVYLAGIYDTPLPGKGMYSRFSILTTEANESVRPVHDRMPVVIRESQIDDWLKNEETYNEILFSQPMELRCVREVEQLKIGL